MYNNRGFKTGFRSETYLTQLPLDPAKTAGEKVK